MTNTVEQIGHDCRTYQQSDGYLSHYRLWGHPESEDVVVLLHGGISHSGWQAPLAQEVVSSSDISFIGLRPARFRAQHRVAWPSAITGARDRGHHLFPSLVEELIYAGPPSRLVLRWPDRINRRRPGGRSARHLQPGHGCSGLRVH